MAFRDILRGICDLILNNKLIFFLSVALFAFIIATIALAVENNSNADDLASCRDSLWHATSVAPPASTRLQPAETTTVAGAETTSSTPEVPTTTSEKPAPQNQGKFLTLHDYREQIRRR
ncbi:AAEL003764-PA [Aedes aegypti]|uniref:AAEL003764-PA n=1 Tax=Aedes aegypti TaxID=7159 RepID=Q0IG06_AEDAE|nr:AAEL003764-PA [Aedes aegypti]